MSKIPERYRHFVENTQDMGVTEKMVAPPPFKENVFSQDFENIRFYYPLFTLLIETSVIPSPPLGNNL